MSEIKKLTNKQMIDAIKSNYPPENYTMLREALDKSMELLEKQIPKKIVDDTVLDGDYSGSCYERKIAVCPTCNNIYLTHKQPYCNKCGQALDWSENDG